MMQNDFGAFSERCIQFLFLKGYNQFGEKLALLEDSDGNMAFITLCTTGCKTIYINKAYHISYFLGCDKSLFTCFNQSHHFYRPFSEEFG